MMTTPEKPSLSNIIGPIILLLWVATCWFGSSSDKPKGTTQGRSSGCGEDLKCHVEKSSVTASALCPPYIERFAQYSHKWVGGFLAPTFAGGVWKDQPGKIITFLGDNVEFQNGFGAWQRHIYECDVDVVRDRVINVRVYPGRL